MNRIENAFKNNKAFIPFITAGDPNLDVTERLAVAMARAGADLIELGIPFSDPVAEGPVIQRASQRSLAVGTTTDKLFPLVENIRKQTNVPLAFMTYANPVFTYGADKFFARCAATGIDAVIIPDTPFEEKGEFYPYGKKHGVAYISLIAPTSRDRAANIAREAEGFLYCVSSLGVTGVRSEIQSGIAGLIDEAKRAAAIPCAIGFGISTPQQAKDMAAIADGVIIGSAIVKIVEEYGENCVQPVCEFVKEIKKAIG